MHPFALNVGACCKNVTLSLFDQIADKLSASPSQLPNLKLLRVTSRIAALHYTETLTMAGPYPSSIVTSSEAQPADVVMTRTRLTDLLGAWRHPRPYGFAAASPCTERKFQDDLMQPCHTNAMPPPRLIHHNDCVRLHTSQPACHAPVGVRACMPACLHTSQLMHQPARPSAHCALQACISTRQRACARVRMPVHPSTRLLACLSAHP